MKAVEDKAALSGRRQAAMTVNSPQLLVDESDLHFRQFVHDALAFASRLQAVRDGFARLLGLTGIQYTILISIYHLEFERRVGITTVAEHLHLSGTFVTTETNKLVERGLVTKTRDADDKRRINLRSTEQARARLSRLGSVQSHVNDVHFGPLTAGDFELMRRIMPALVRSTDRALRLLDAIPSLDDGPVPADTIRETSK